MVLEYTDLYSIQTPDVNGITCNPMPSLCDPTECTSESCPTQLCYQYEYCRNVKNARSLTSGKQLSQLQENRDVHSVYEGDYIKTINLLVGIIGVFSFIFYNK
jgi:hypothetical protein